MIKLFSTNYRFRFFFFLLADKDDCAEHRGQNHCSSSGGSRFIPTHGLLV